MGAAPVGDRFNSGASIDVIGNSQLGSMRGQRILCHMQPQAGEVTSAPMSRKDPTMNGYTADIEKLTEDNAAFQNGLSTGGWLLRRDAVAL